MNLFTNLFKDRMEAADRLADRLMSYRGQNPLILGIPRGAIPLARRVADRLEGDLDVVLVHKIGAPNNPEYAIGSVSEFGTIYLSDAAQDYGDLTRFLETSTKYELEQLNQKRQKYSPVRLPLIPKDRVVIIVDDGIATGATMLSAIRAIRSQNPRKLIIAAPVASGTAMELLCPEVDECIVLETPDNFFAISQFYEDFPQVSDEEVLSLLRNESIEPTLKRTG